MTKDFKTKPSQIHCSDQYDPNHPDADWSGFVSRRTSRKHIPCKPDQLVAIDGNAFGPADHVATAEWTKPARKIVGHKESGADDDAHAHAQIDIHMKEGGAYKHANTSSSASARSSTFSLIGGPVPTSSPSKFSPQCWKSEAQTANMRVKTDLEQLTDRGRSKHVRGRKGFVREEGEEVKALPLQGHDNSSMDSEDVSRDPDDFIGFRTSNVKVTCSDSSFLKEVGNAVEKLRGSPYVTSTSFDPYRTASGERRKDLLYENFPRTTCTRNRTSIT